MPSRIRIYVSTLSLLAIAAAAKVYMIAPDVGSGFVRAAAVFATLSAICEMMAWKKAARSESGSISFLPILAAVIVAPHWVTVAAVTIATLAVQIANRRVLIKAVFNVVQIVICVSLAILVYTALGGQPLIAEARPKLFAFVAILLVFVVVNSGALAGAIALSENEKFWNLWWRRARVTVFFDLLTLPGVYVFAYCYLHWGALGAGFLVIPILIIRSLYKVNWELQQTNQ